jgi:hypothetical protein
MGAVARPGTFEMQEPRLPLLELVKLAGGATPRASGNVRIIRDGRAGEQTYLSPDLKYELLPNDLVILDLSPSRSLQPNRGGRLTGPNLLESNTSGPPAPPNVQLGLVNLISGPVVLEVSAQEARLGTVLSLLHQSADDIGELTIIQPLTGTESVFCDEAVDMPLGSGCILVFDSATVDAASLPTLPARVGVPNSNTASAAEPVTPRESIPQVLTRMQAEAKRAGTPESGEADVQEASDDDAASPGESTSRQAAPSADLASVSEDQQGAVSHTGWLVLIGAAVPGVIAFAVTRWRSKRRVRTEIPDEAPAVPDGTQTLKGLISNSLPVVEEAILLPKEATIFGRPRLDSPHRFDAAHAIHGPHYTVEPAIPAQEPARASRAPQNLRAVERGQKLDDLQAECPPDPPRPERVPPAAQQGHASPQAEDDTPARKIRVDRAHLRSSLGTLDRALAIFEERRP